MNLEFNIKNIKKTVAVAMSGGVDSSTTAYILKKQGYNVFGITMKTYGKEDEDAKKICEDLEIEHYILDVTREFEEEVINYFINEYSLGRTPNPCMMCNKKIKFGKLIEFAMEKGADFLATGHYANLENGNLVIGDDSSKDQVYFLSHIKKKYLEKIMFPLGKMKKSVVRELAKNLGIRVHAKKDSQEICFIKNEELKDFLIRKTNGKIYKPGKIIDTEGKVLGIHNGLAFHTIGQRKGLGITSLEPLYVVALDTYENIVIVGNNNDLLKKKLIAENINLLSKESIKNLDKIECFVKTRSRDRLHPCRLNLLDDNTIEIELIEDEIRAITPGQGAVFYTESGEVIGGAFIKN
ncbi:tRNA 2-thiouridine(34) synthase MnmA [Cetobacterium somerae]|uniref:tRNA 2-thiouridine(34) synthase MnmA n=1 Tax=Cetobacterium somerae TaxID=188913 RepID=UPI00211E1E1E|nr:tRNA 2-thiouridine(34) synthase MnmA [Cetobacterium somerae]MCQ9628345.1 tRNA 2-thiouridine(34) synthase MnmA [Cetobacterium somerae]